MRQNLILYRPALSNISNKAQIGDYVKIHSHVWIGDNVIIGDKVTIQAFAFIPPGTIIGDNVFIGPHVCIGNDKYPPSKGKQWEKVIIEKNARIGMGAVILPGVTISKNAMVGAGAVVTKDVLDGMTVVGNPAIPL